MKNKFLSLLFVILSFSLVTPNLLNGDNRIVISLKHAPAKVLTLVEQEFLKEKTLKKMNNLDRKTPSQINNKFLKGKIKKLLKPALTGFIALYSGFMDYSNSDGLISFPLRHLEPKIYLAFTTRINLVKARGVTISHKEYVKDPKFETAIYLFEKKQNDKGRFFWQVSKQPVPTDKRINPLTVVILTKPKNFYVPFEDFLSTDSKQIVLPSIYVLDDSSKKEILLNSLDIKRFFEPIEVEERTVNEIIQQMISNL